MVRITLRIRMSTNLRMRLSLGPSRHIRILSIRAIRIRSRVRVRIRNRIVSIRISSIRILSIGRVIRSIRSIHSIRTIGIIGARVVFVFSHLFRRASGPPLFGDSWATLPRFGDPAAMPARRHQAPPALRRERRARAPKPSSRPDMRRCAKYLFPGT